MTLEHRIQAGDKLQGICYCNGMLYTTERREEDTLFRYRLAVYRVGNQNNVTLLNTLDLDGNAWEPRVDHQIGQVYSPCWSSGISVVRYDGRQLVPITTLRCVGKPHCLAVVSTNSLYASDLDSKAVCLVDVAHDRVTARLQGPLGAKRQQPDSIAVLGDTVLVDYRVEQLVIYRHGASTPVKLLPWPQLLKSEFGLTTDHHSSFLLTNSESRVLYVLDISGNLTHTVTIPGTRQQCNCCVGEGQLWARCYNGYIVVMSSK